MNKQKQVFQLLSKVVGNENIIAAPKIFFEYTGDWNSAIFLSQLLYWSDKGKNPDGWIYKTYAKWKEEVGIKEGALRRAANKLKELGILETKVKRANGSPTVHYRLNIDTFVESILSLAQNGICQNDSMDTAKMEETLTETTTETTTETIKNISDFEEKANNLSDYKQRIVNAVREGYVENADKKALHYPQDVWEVIEAFSKYFGISPPSRKSPEYGRWIKESRAIMEACAGRDPAEQIKKVFFDWDREGRKWRILAPGSILRVIRGTANKPEEKGQRVQLPDGTIALKYSDGRVVREDGSLY